jgi:hypothetical protein
LTKNFSLFTVDPLNPSERQEVSIPGDLIRRLYTYEPVAYENFRAVKEVLESPERIFSGVRLFAQGGWCVVGRPAQWCLRENVIAISR